MSRPSRIPAGTTTRFALLIAAVVATSAFSFVYIYAHAPGKAGRLTSTLATCAAQRDQHPDFQAPVETVEDLGRYEAVIRQWQLCNLPVILDQAAFSVAGTLLLFILAGLFYLLHPWWISRRRRLRPLTAEGSPGLVSYLDSLARQMGLARTPAWRLAPYGRTSGGQAFGTFGWHVVQIDAGLAIRYVTDRPSFRAVALHELAHVRNRDVGKTYLTIGIWRAFLLVCVLPLLALIVHPGLLTQPGQWHWETTAFATDPKEASYLLGSLLLLTVLVYLSRNAILRARELHADATAAAFDDADGALAATVSRLPQPSSRWAGWRRRWGTHPSPAARQAAIADPGRLLRGGVWEMAGVGVAAGAFAANLGFLASFYLVTNPVLALTLTGFTAGALIAGMLTVVLCRAAAGSPGYRLAAPTVLAHAIAGAGGFFAGTKVSLMGAVYPASFASALPLTSQVGAVLLLIIGVAAVAVWIAATAAHPAVVTGRWAVVVVALTTIITFAPILGVWFAHSQIEAGFAVTPGYLPESGAGIGWYSAVAQWSGANVGPLYLVVLNPLTLPTFALLWLVPVVVANRGKVKWAYAFAPAAAGTCAIAILGVALPFAAKTSLPASVRREAGTPRLDDAPFLAVYDNVFLTVSSLVVALVIAAVLLLAPAQRLALALLAANVTSVLAIGVLLIVNDPITCALNVHELAQRPAACIDAPAPVFPARALHWIAVQGVLLALPLSALAALVRAIIPAPKAQPDEDSPSQIRAALAGAALIVLAVVDLSAAVTIAPKAAEIWLDGVLN